MLKRFMTLAATLLLVLAFAGTASAARKQFEHFSADIPAGWKVQEVNGAVEIKSPDGSSTLAVSFSQSGDVETLGAGMMEALGADEGGLDEDGDFVFAFEKDGAPGMCILSDDGEVMVIVLMHGDIEQLEPIYNSVED